MPQALKAIYLAAVTGGCFLFFWLGSFFLSWFVLPLIHLGLFRRPWTQRVRRSQAVVGRGYVLFIALMRWVRNLVFHPRAASLDLPDGPFVLIANHPTLIDVTAMLAVHPTICCVAKTGLFRSILVGRLLRYCGHIEGGGGLMDGASVIIQGVERLRSGLPIMVFPEGTRSPAYGIRRFKPGAFKIAIQAGVPIVPVLLTCEPPTLLKGLRWFELPKTTARFELTQLPTIPAEALGDCAASLAARVQEMLQNHLDAWRARLPAGDRIKSDCASVGWTSSAGQEPS